jgi:hypothetical protein
VSVADAHAAASVDTPHHGAVFWMHPVQSPDRFPVLVILIAIVAGLLVWHATRANQARLGIRSRRGQIKGMWREIRTFALGASSC